MKYASKKRKELQSRLAELIRPKQGRTAPMGRTPIGIENIPRLNER